MALRARALYDFRWENPGEISLREHEVLSLCSEQDIEGWLEGCRGHRGLFPASYVQVIRAPEPGPARYGGPGAPAQLANVPPSGFEPLPAPPPASFKPPPNASLGGGALQPSPQQLYGGYQASQGSDDDWDNEWDDSSTVVDEPGTLGSRSAGGGSARRYRLSTRSDLSWAPAAPPQHHPLGAKSSATVSRNLNRFSTFAESGGEAFVLREASGFVKDGDELCVVLGPYGPEWQENPYPFQCTIHDPTKQTKFKGMKSYISYKLVPTHTQVPVHGATTAFDWLTRAWPREVPGHSVPHLPEKQAPAFEEDFISKRRKGLIWWMNHMASHPVLAQCDVFQHLLTCPSSTDEKAWKQGKRKMVGANFLRDVSTPPAAALDACRRIGEQIALQVLHQEDGRQRAAAHHPQANEFPRKQVTGFKKEYQKVGQSFAQAFSVGLNQAIAFTGDGQLPNFGLHPRSKGSYKVKESRRHVEEGKMEVQKADGIQDRLRDFKSQMQHFLQTNIIFPKVTQKLEEALHKYGVFNDWTWIVDFFQLQG
uniref:Sorting nexin n=1 Tax=Microcebus murinus TaxID=30608 RepID=A0A8C5YA36_MICMU